METLLQEQYEQRNLQDNCNLFKYAADASFSIGFSQYDPSSF